MRRMVSQGELLVGVEGAALLRRVVDGDDAFVAARLDAIRRLLASSEEGAFALPLSARELDVDAGYEAWAPVYDEMSNFLIRAEEPMVEAGLDGVAPGVALDAACGTGRHAARLAAAGHRTIGVDRSEAMLNVGRAKLPAVEFRTGELTELPLRQSSVDVAVCALALTHLHDPAAAIAELARVVRPKGRIVISDAHPFFVAIQGQALFRHQEGFAFVRNHVISHGTYLRAFRAAGLNVLDCAEAPTDHDFENGLMAGAAEAAASLWRELPVALVWTLERR